MKRSDDNRGAAMVVVLCVMVVFLALSTTIILAGSVSLNTARMNVLFERGKVQAATLSEQFVKDMNAKIGDEPGVDESDQKKQTLVRYLRDEIMNTSAPWPAYDGAANREAAVRTFTLDTGEGDDAVKHQIRVEMYWTCDKDGKRVQNLSEAFAGEGSEGSPAGENAEEKLSTNIESGSIKVHLFIDVISTLNGQEYHVKRDFRLSAVSEREGIDPADPYPYEWRWEAQGRNNDGRD